MSEIIQLLSLAVITAGIWIWLGLPAGLIAAGLAGLLVGEAVDQ